MSGGVQSVAYFDDYNFSSHCDINATVCFQCEHNEYERADRLMNILERRRDSLLTQFYCALEATDQHDLVQLIKYKGTSLVPQTGLLYRKNYT